MSCEKLVTIAENQFKVYITGHNDGQKIGYDDGYAAGIYDGYNNGYEEGLQDGITSAYDEFWDIYQDNGNRRAYAYAFCGKGWVNTLFTPKYPIIAQGDASYVFSDCAVTDFDFVERGITLDLSGATSLTYIFRNASGIKRLGVVDCSSCKNLNRLFYNCKVETIDSFVINENITYSNTFDYARIKNIKISGTIAQNGFSLTSVVLSRDSIESIINALSTATSGLSITLSKVAVNTAFETSEGAADGSTSEEWLALIATRSNWTITLA